MVTFNAYKSHLKQELFELSNGDADISDIVEFPKFHDIFSEMSKKIRTAERGKNNY